jgi:hypothetical protein
MPKLIKINNNGSKEEYLGITTSAGAGNSGDFPVLDGTGKLDTTFMPVGVGQDAVTAIAGEALSAGNMVYFNGSGQVLKADATALGKAARGYVNSNFSNGATATVFFDDSNTGLTGLTSGATYYLSKTAGLVTTNVSAYVAGDVIQEIGFATSTTNLRVNIQEPVLKA